MPEKETLQDLDLDEYKYDFVNEEKHVFRTEPGLTEEVVRQISALKDEPEWMLEFRLKALKIYYSNPMPKWGGDLSDLDRVLDEIYYDVRPQDKMEHSWDSRRKPFILYMEWTSKGLSEVRHRRVAGIS